MGELEHSNEQRGNQETLELGTVGHSAGRQCLSSRLLPAGFQLMEGKQKDQKILPIIGSGEQKRHQGGSWAPALSVSGSCCYEATCLPLMGLTLLSVNLGAKGAGQNLFSLASLMMTGIYFRSTVSQKSEVWADTWGEGAGSLSSKESRKPPQGVLMTTAHGLKISRS